MIKRKNKAILCAIASITLANSTLVNTALAIDTDLSISSVSTITSMKVYNTNSLNVRKGPGTKYAKLGTVSNGQVLDVISISNGWAKISFKGETAYVSSSYLTKVNSAPTVIKEMIVQIDDLNVRTGNSTNYSIVGKLKKGDKVSVIEQLSSGWVKIYYNEATRYVSNISGKYLKDIVSSPSTPAPPDNSNPNTPSTPDNSNPNTPSTPDNSNPSDTTIKYSTNADLNLRKTESWSSTILTVVKKGVVLDSLSASNSWIKVKYNGYTGYLPISHLTKISSSTPSTPTPPSTPPTPSVKKYMVVKSATLNVRSGSSTSYKTLGTLKKGDVVVVESELTNGWVKIEYKGGFGYVSNVKSAYLEESKEEMDKASAQKVIAMINALNSTVTLDDAIEVEDARRAFDSLNSEAKSLVSNVQKLIAAESEISRLDVIEINKTNVVAEKIDELEALGEVTIANLQDIKDKVSEIDTLVADIHPLHVQNISGLRIVNTVKEKITSIEKYIADAKKVEDMIALLDGVTIEASHKVQINEARKAFDELNSPAKQLVSNEQILIDAENDLQVITEKVNAIANRIDALPAINEIKLSDEQIILDIIAEVEALTPDELALIPSLELEFLEGAYVTVQNLKLAGQEEVIVNELIIKLESFHNRLDTLNYSDKDEFDSMKETYSKLTEYGKNLLVSYTNKFVEVQNKMNSVYESIMEVEYLIESLPDVIEYAHKNVVLEAYNKYEALEQANKNSVKLENITKLMDAKSTIDALEIRKQEILATNLEVQAVVAEIASLPAVEVITIDNKEEVFEAVNKFRILDRDVQFAVDTTKLEQSFDKIEGLMAEEVVDAISKLPSIDDLDLSHTDLLVSVREQYKEISMRNNNKVTNIDILDNLEAKMLELKGENPEIIQIMNMIKALDKNVTFDNFDKVVADVKAIDVLLDAILADDNSNGTNEYDKIANIETYNEVLTQLEVLNRVSDVTTVEQVQDMINTLPEPADVTWYRHDDIIDARNAFIKVPGANNETKLIAVEQAYAVIENAVNEVISAIHVIPNIDEITKDSEAVIRHAETIYNKYDEKVKGPADQITKYKLHNALNKLDEILKF